MASLVAGTKYRGEFEERVGKILKEIEEHDEVKAYLIISSDNYTTNENNPYYRDCTITFDIICYTDY